MTETAAVERDMAFAPILGDDPRYLILGSMPSRASLQAQQYYAHPRNAFWRVMEEIVGFPAAAPYEARCEALKSQRIAVWDVLAQCCRPGSLDAAIVRSSEAPNDFVPLFEQHPNLRQLRFNGAKSQELFMRHAKPCIQRFALDCRRLPSTSPANAAWSFERKLAAWQENVTIAG